MTAAEGLTIGASDGRVAGLPRWNELSFVQVTSLPRVEDDDARRILRRQLRAGTIDAGAARRPLAAIWTRPEPGAPLAIYLSTTGDPDPAGDDSMLLAHPPGARGRPVPATTVAHSVERHQAWIRCGAVIDPLLVGDQSSDRVAPAGFDDYISFLGAAAFVWLVLADPLPGPAIHDELETLRRAISRLEVKAAASMATTMERERAEARYRELMTARPAGLWNVHVLVGAATPLAATRTASLLSAGTDLDGLPYRLLPQGDPKDLHSAATAHFDDPAAGASPFLATSELLARLAKPPEKELPGVRLVARSTFDISPEVYPTPPSLPDPLPRAGPAGVELGFVLDEALRPTQPLTLHHMSLNRHTFVCGATGGGKSQTVRTLLEQLSRLQPDPIPWLVIEPAKAEYAGMAGRLSDLPDQRGMVHVLRPGDPAVFPACLNPLEPSSLEPGNPERTFSLQAHADLVRALFMAAFHADEPFPQVLSAALADCYEAMGWDLVTSQPRHAQLQQFDSRTVPAGTDWTPRFPRLSDLQRAAREVVDSIGYDEDIKKRVRGFVDVRIGSLRTGAPGRFFEGGHPLDVARMLTRNTVIEAETVTNDQDKAFVMGVILIRIYEQLLLEARERTGPQLRHVTVIEEAHRLLRRVDSDSPIAHSIELFAGMLAEVRAYGEGLIVAEQIPGKIVTDVIKNTAIKIVHRLPATDDREAVGGTMNLSAEQSAYVVSLTPGKAAVFIDGMDRPVLTAVDSNEAAESAANVQRDMPLQGAGRVSPACGGPCVEHAPCTLRQLRSGERLLHDNPQLTLWVDASCLAHIAGGPAPAFRPTPPSRLLQSLAERDPRLVGCAIAHAVERAVSLRYRRLAAYYNPDALATHLAAAAWAAVQDANPIHCTRDRGDWRAGRHRFADLVEVLDALMEGRKARYSVDEVLTIAGRRGLILRPSDPADIKWQLTSLPWHHYPGPEQHALEVGDPDRMAALTAAEALLGRGEPRSLLTTAIEENLQWKAPAGARAVLARLTASIPEGPKTGEVT